MTRRRLVAPVAALVVAAGMASAAPPLNPNPAFRDFFRGLMRPDTNSSCCDDTDCRFTEARVGANGWRARTQAGDWVDIPESKILRGKATPTGEPILCWLPATGVLCFVPPIGA